MRSLLLLGILLSIVFPLAQTAAPAGLRVLSAYCTAIDILVYAPGRQPVLLVDGLSCGAQSRRIFFNASSVQIHVLSSASNSTLAEFGAMSSLSPSSLLPEVVLPSNRTSIILTNDTLIDRPSFLAVNDQEEEAKITLGIDTAQVRYVGVGDAAQVLKLAKLHLLGRSTQCFDCLAENLLYSLLYLEPQLIYIDTRWQYDLFMSNDTGEMLTKEWRAMASVRRLFNEHSHYTLVATLDPFPAMYVFLDKEGVSTYLPIWLSIAFFAAVALIWAVLYNAYRAWFVPRCCDLWDWGTDLVRLRDTSFSNQRSSLSGDFSKPKRVRLHGLDAFRGFWILATIFFNYGGGGYWVFRGSPWNGMTIFDLAIPMLMVCMGCAMAFTIDAWAENPRNALPLLFRVSKRTAVLYMFGLAGLLNANEKHFRYMGPLQQFGLAFWLTSMIVIFVPRYRAGIPRVVDESLSLLNNHNDTSLRGAMVGLRPYVFQWLLVLCIASVHPILQLHMHVPGCPTGYRGPGGIGDFGKYPNCTGGAVVYIDKVVFGVDHIYPYPTCKSGSGLAAGDGGLYGCTALEPQGMLSFCTMILLVYIGLQIGRFIRLVRTDCGTITRMLIVAAVMLGTSMALCGGKQNGGFIPINKNLNSISYILLAGGLAVLLITLSYVVVDVAGLWNGAPFRYPGLNAVGLGIISEIVQLGWPFDWQPTPQHANILVMNLTSVIIFTLVADWAYLHGDWRLVA